ncbi:thiamine pyrophosphate-dependent enzyme [Dactylosporangium sp. NPDC051484]|uniref:thiamine pyrophosphate-dependent enzyme n=1 Tax=Dactylosporangium sp. NPDC051484 TaxID=3154942 RepID=UPI00344CA62C
MLSALERVLPADRTVVFDGGRFLGEAFKYLEVAGSAHQVLSTSFGAVGLGMGAATSAAVAAPDAPATLVTGDGGYLMSGLAELHLARRHDRPLVVLVCNDGSYRSEYNQYVAKQVRPGLPLFEWPSFADAARAFGVPGFRVVYPADLGPALEAVEAGCSVVIDLVLGITDIPEVPQ